MNDNDKQREAANAEASERFLIVGLGNTGRNYAGNRHNIGFMAVDLWCEQFAPSLAWTENWSAHTCSLRFQGIRCVVLKPQTYMNRSGSSVTAAAHYFRIPPEQIIVMHDELDFPLGRLAIKKGGGHGGHNGLRDIISQLGSRDFLRIRLGIGRSKQLDATHHVLSNFDPAEQSEVENLLKHAQLATNCLLTEGLATAMNRFNHAASQP